MTLLAGSIWIDDHRAPVYWHPEGSRVLDLSNLPPGVKVYLDTFQPDDGNPRIGGVVGSPADIRVIVASGPVPASGDLFYKITDHRWWVQNMHNIIPPADAEQAWKIDDPKTPLERAKWAAWQETWGTGDSPDTYYALVQLINSLDDGS